MTLPDAILLLCLGWGDPHPELPPLSDLQRFPVRWVAQEQLRANIAHRDWLRAQQQSQPWEWGWDFWAAENQELWSTWNLLDDCWIEWTDGYSDDPAFDADTYRRGLLAQLRDRLGYRDYYEGRMPPPVPIWRFRRQ